MKWRVWLSIGVLLGFLSLTSQVSTSQAEETIDDFNFESVSIPSSGENLTEAQLAFDDRRATEKYKLYQSSIITVALLISLIVVLAFIAKTSFTAVNIMNACALTLIVFATMFISIIADTDQQLTASMGILGAISGYLFGTMRKGDGEEKRKEQD